VKVLPDSATVPATVSNSFGVFRSLGNWEDGGKAGICKSGDMPSELLSRANASGWVTGGGFVKTYSLQ